MNARPAWPSLNRTVMPLVRDLVERAADLRISAERQADGHTLIDAGIDVPGGIEAGLRIAEIWALSRKIRWKATWQTCEWPAKT